MQISNTASYTHTHRMPSSASIPGANNGQASSAPNHTKPQAISYADKVTLSTAARELSAQAERGLVERPVPLPEKPSDADIKGDYIALKQTQYKYKVASDAVNLATGNSQGLSASSVHYLANNDQAREQTVMVMAAQSQASLAQSYMQQSSGEEQESDNEPVTVQPYTPTLETALLAASASLLAKYGKEEQTSSNMAQTAA